MPKLAHQDSTVLTDDAPRTLAAPPTTRPSDRAT